MGRTRCTENATNTWIVDIASLLKHRWLNVLPMMMVVLTDGRGGVVCGGFAGRGGVAGGGGGGAGHRGIERSGGGGRRGGVE